MSRGHSRPCLRPPGLVLEVQLLRDGSWGIKDRVASYLNKPGKISSSKQACACGCFQFVRPQEICGELGFIGLMPDTVTQLCVQGFYQALNALAKCCATLSDGHPILTTPHLHRSGHVFVKNGGQETAESCFAALG